MLRKFLGFFTVLLLAVVLVACDDDKKNTSSSQPEEKDTTQPVLTGVEDITIYVGDEFDPMEGVKATDDVDGDITDRIKVYGTVDTSKEGTTTLRYEVADNAGNVAQKYRQVTVVYVGEKEGLLVNPNFDDGLNGWDHDNIEGGMSTSEVVDGVVKIVITDTGWGGSHSVRLKQDGITFEQGKTYEISFKARAEEERHIIVQTGMLFDQAPWFEKYDQGDMIVKLTTEMKEYKVKFNMTAETTDEASLIFEFGKINRGDIVEEIKTTIYFDDVDIQEVEPDPDTEAPTITGVEDKEIRVGTQFDPMAGVGVTDNLDYTLTVEDIEVEGEVDINTPGTYKLIYRVKDASGNEAIVERTITVKDFDFEDSGLLPNGDFEEDSLAGWDYYDGEGATTATFEIVDGELVLTLTQKGTELWHGQLFFSPVNFERGRTYRLVFKAKADVATAINVVVGDQITEAPWFEIYHTELINISTDYQSFEVMFTMTDEELTEGRVKFELGTGDHTKIYFDDIKLEVAKEEKIIENGTFETNEGWKTNYGSEDQPAVVEDGEVKFETSDGPWANPWDNQLFTDGLKFDINVTYKVQFKARALDARPIIVKVEVPDQGYYTFAEETIELTDEMTTYEFTFTADFDTTGGKLGFLMGNVSDTTVATTIFIDDVSITVAPQAPVEE